MEDASIKGYEDILVEALQTFRCYKDLDVQEFLNNKAIQFEIRGWATTYLFLSEADWENGDIVVEGYFSLNHKAVSYANTVSLSTRKKISGDKKANMESFVLIGQLGKRMEKNQDGTISVSDLSGNDLLDDAIASIERASNHIVCRNIIIECKPIEKVKAIYEDYGFSDLQFNSITSLHMLYLKLKNKVHFDPIGVTDT